MWGPAGACRWGGRQEQAGPLVRPQGLLSSTAVLSSTAAGQRALWAVADLACPRSGRLAVEAGGGEGRGRAVLGCLTARPGASQVSVPPLLCWAGAGEGAPQHLACAGHSFDVYQVKGGRQERMMGKPSPEPTSLWPGGSPAQTSLHPPQLGLGLGVTPVRPQAPMPPGLCSGPWNLGLACSFLIPNTTIPDPIPHLSNPRTGPASYPAPPSLLPHCQT